MTDKDLEIAGMNRSEYDRYIRNKHLDICSELSTGTLYGFKINMDNPMEVTVGAYKLAKREEKTT